MNNSNNNISGATVKTRKRKVVEEEEHHALVVRSSSGVTHTFRSGIGNDSRIVRVSRSSGGKDRHSKVLTAKGLRDRRVRLSVPTAIQFYDLQDRLGFDQPSKAVEWLIKAAADAIDELPVLDPPFHSTFSNIIPAQPPHYSNSNNIINANQQGKAFAGGGGGGGGTNVFAESSSAVGMSSTNDSHSSREGQQGECEMSIMMQQHQAQAQAALGKSKNKMSSSSTNSEEEEEEEEEEARCSKETEETYYSGLSLTRSETRAKARARARERAKGKFQLPASATCAAALEQNQHSDNDGVRDSFTGLLNSVAHVALESRDTDQNNRDLPHKSPSTGLSMNITQHPHLYHSHAPPTIPPEHLNYDPPQHILHASAIMPQQSLASQSFSFPSFLNATIFSPITLQRNENTKPISAVSTASQDHRHHHNNHLLAHFASNPSVLLQQPQQHSFYLGVDQEEQHHHQQLVPIISHDHMFNFSMPGVSGRETVQSNSYNNMAYYMPSTHRTHSADQTPHASMFTTARNSHAQGGYDARMLQRSIQDVDSNQGSRSPAPKGIKKHENQYN